MNIMTYDAAISDYPRLNGDLLVSDCMFRKTCPNAELLKGSRDGIIWRDNILTDGFEW